MIQPDYADLEELCMSKDADGIDKVLTGMGFTRKTGFLKREKPNEIDYLFIEQDGTYSLAIPKGEAKEFEKLYTRFKGRYESFEAPVAFLSGLYGLWAGAFIGSFISNNLLVPMLIGVTAMSYAGYKLCGLFKNRSLKGTFDKLEANFRKYAEKSEKPFDYSLINKVLQTY